MVSDLARLTPILIFVHRFDECFQFYRKVFGLKLVRLYRGKQHPPWAEFQIGEARLALHGDYNGPPLKICEPLALHFDVKDIRRTMARIKRYGGKVKRGPRRIDFRPAELQVVYAATFTDPDGNEFDLHQVLKRFRN